MRDSPILVEACVDSVVSSVAAERGGARRLELCDALFDGGTTPSAGMIAACKATVSIPVFVMIRPRGGGFVYSDAERDVMRRDVVVARELGADGVVIGGLRPDGIVDLALVRFLVEAAHELPVTFHRAFDLTPDFEASLDPRRFVRIHRSTIVNLEQVSRLTPHGHGEYVITLRNGAHLNTSRTYAARLQAVLK